MSAHSPRDLGGPSPSQIRELSTRASLVVIRARFEKIDQHLAEAMSEHWEQQDVPQPSINASNAISKDAPSHPYLLDTINNLLSSIENRVEFISARL